MGKSKEIRYKILYELMFVATIPAILIIWAKLTRDIVTIPLPFDLIPGYILLVTGTILVTSGIWILWRSDNRLPVNVIPQKRFPKNGISHFTCQPIYSGAVLISFGVSAVTRSLSGFWLVSPLFSLLMVAYAEAIKNGKTQSVFDTQGYKPFLSLPSDSGIKPSSWDRLSSYFLVFVPWLIIYKAFIFIGAPDDAIITNLHFEERFPVWEFSTVFYSFAFLFSLLVPLVVKTRRQLRHFITDVWFAIIFVGIIYLVFPLIIKQKEFIPHSFLGRIILYERSIDGESGALPSCHVIWAFLAARYFSRSFASFKWIWFGLAVLISVSCITVGAHSILDVVAGFCAFMIIIYRQNIRNYLRLQAERLSTNRREWIIGPLRLSNHGLYSGAAGFTGTLLTGFFLGPQYALAGLLILIFVIAGVRLLTQLVEGPLQLVRTYIYFGGLIGGIIAFILANLIFSVDIFILLASFIMAAPWVHAIGRLRYFHPTQLYSIGINIITGLVLIRLFNIGISSSFIVGIYLILTGTGRFVEESLRDEDQRQNRAGMNIPQWIAVLYVLSGIIFTVIPGTTVLLFQPNLLSLGLAIGMGILFAILYGVGIPESKTAFDKPVR